MNAAGIIRLTTLVLGVWAAAGAERAEAQRQGPPAQSQGTDELSRIRQAAALEEAGDFAGAEKLVRQVLDGNPTSLSALLTLERLLTLQGRAPEIIGPIDRLLERDPSSVVAHQARLRAQALIGSAAGIEMAAAAWIRAMPHLETPYREIGAVWRQRGEHARAIAVLEQGRKRIDRPDALALELGDAYLAAGDLRRAAAEWTRAVGPEGRGFMLVQRRLQGLSDGGANVMPLLVEGLVSDGATPGRLKAATLFAIDAGLAGRAQRYASELSSRVQAREKEPTLVEVGRRADGAGLYGLAAWAYSELLREPRDPGATLALRSRLAELALLAGDTALAVDAYRQLERAAAAGSPQRRQAMALRIGLKVRDSDLAGASADLEQLRKEFPQASELDEAAAMVAGVHHEAGRAAEAEAVMTGISGPRTSQLRGRLALASGDVERAREAFLSAAPHLHGREATEVIGLAALLVRLSPAGGELLARVVSTPEPERATTLRSAAQRAGTLPAAERAAIQDFLAGIAERSGLNEEADQLRRDLLAAHPRAQEAPAALLALARRAMEREESADEARIMLEKVILDYPRSALVPQARRELERLQGGHTR